MMVLYNFLGDI